MIVATARPKTIHFCKRLGSSSNIEGTPPMQPKKTNIPVPMTSAIQTEINHQMLFAVAFLRAAPKNRRKKWISLNLAPNLNMIILSPATICLHFGTGALGEA